MMILTLLAAVDCSDNSGSLLEHAAYLAIEFDAAVHVVSVVMPGNGWTAALAGEFAEVSQTLERDAHNALARSCALLADKGVSCTTHTAVGPVAREIARLAEELGADLIVIGHRHLSWLDRLMENSVGKNLLACAPCNVLVVVGDKGA